jgi:hypothetical protein
MLKSGKDVSCHGEKVFFVHAKSVDLIELDEMITFDNMGLSYNMGLKAHES